MAASAISSDLPMRPMGCMAVIWRTEFGLLAGKALEHVGVDYRRQNGVDADALFAELQGGRFREANDGMLAGHVDFNARHGDHSQPRRSIHNGAASRLEHGWDFILHAQPHPLHVDVHDAIVGLLVLLEKRRRLLLDPGIVEGEVEPAKLLHRPVDELLDLGRLRHIGRHEKSFASLGPEEPHGLFTFGRSSAGDNDPGPLPGIGDGGCPADS